MSLLDANLAWPILGAVVAGGIIGAEREYRASPAGFRTHILVSLSSALLMLAAVHQVRWLSDTPTDIIRIDPVRMAHGILTGVGFLCGGVIFREGLNVRGLTTAASLWTTSSLGILFGVGFYSLAIVGTATTLVVLAALAASEALLPQRRYISLKIRYARNADMPDSYFRDLLEESGLRLSAIEQRMEGDMLEFGTTVSTNRDDRLTLLLRKLRDHPDVRGFDCVPGDS